MNREMKIHHETMSIEESLFAMGRIHEVIEREFDGSLGSLQNGFNLSKTLIENPSEFWDLYYEVLASTDALHLECQQLAASGRLTGNETWDELTQLVESIRPVTTAVTP